MAGIAATGNRCCEPPGGWLSVVGDTQDEPPPSDTRFMSDLILIVEDEQDLVGTLEYNLEHEGFDTRSTEYGEEALELARGDPVPDLIVLDLMLPDISGTEVCRRIRENDATSEIPVLMLTARGEEVDRVVGFEAGADDYVVKPFSMRELILRIRAILRRGRPTDGDAADPSADETEESDETDELTFGAGSHGSARSARAY